MDVTGYPKKNHYPKNISKICEVKSISNSSFNMININDEHPFKKNKIKILNKK